VAVWVNQRRSKRIRTLEEQLPLALDIITRSLRAGHPVIAAIQLASTEMTDPVGSEFGLIVDETNFGADLTTALNSFATRTGSDDAKFFAVAVAVQMESGGNLAEILDNLTRVMRSRATLGKRVKALSSEGRSSAYVLSALPACLIGFQLAFNPRYYTDKFADPIFWPTVAMVLGLYFLGWAIMWRIVNFKY
ncbi:MAG: type II secretion system F family protein, partial [Caulobacterales bacterium]